MNRFSNDHDAETTYNTLNYLVNRTPANIGELCEDITEAEELGASLPSFPIPTSPTLELIEEVLGDCDLNDTDRATLMYWRGHIEAEEDDMERIRLGITEDELEDYSI